MAPMTENPNLAAANRATRTVDAPTIALIGLNGFGRQHLLNIHRLVKLGKARLVAGVSSNDPGADIRGEGVPVYATLGEMAAAGIRPSIIIASTPINTHHDLALQALDLGADLYLEKPPTATLEQYEDLLQAARQAGRLVQVGFQAVGSKALGEVASWFAEAESSPIGALRAVGASGTWVRTRGYYDRAPWAGHRVLDGVQIADGVTTNPLAHAVMSALHIAGAKASGDVQRIEAELHHAHDIEADDTSVIRLRTTAGIPVTCALTLCSTEQRDPWITIHGTEGKAVLYYTRDRLEITPNPDLGGQPSTIEFGRVDLLENLVDVQRGDAEALLCPLEATGAFMRVLETVRTSPEPQAIKPRFVDVVGEGPEAHPVIPQIENLVDRAVAAQSGFSSLGAPWASEPDHSGFLQVPDPATGTGQPVARLRTGHDISPTNSPRPFLDQLRTLGGVRVSDQQPLDHTWHLGVGVALQDVNGNNFWGGRTYTRDHGRYIWRDDHGVIHTRQEVLSADGSRLEADLEWIGRDGQVLLHEQRTVKATGFTRGSGHEQGWILDFTFTLSAPGNTVELGSPGTNGRDKGGYGGFFWRLPQLDGARILSAEAEGEEATHGLVSDWLAISARFQSDSAALDQLGQAHGPATLVFLSRDNDPWFVRCAGYPGIGSSLAWERPVTVRPGEPVSRNVKVLLSDGVLDKSRIEQLAAHYGK
ncbi:PmoA family protein [Glutamicibacter sp. MNS18]|uniref:DUF6807 family protein n=1 Tax=Glutamicibacter sp. MNS18 TaxID=2989817 RepID=UPI0022368F4D|nr:DUF6807 family protein [Glutamicibacter sp. MNS18]MCW4466681.1 PmoA family protein [Glutamicibacter sp. MNS18]